MVFWLRDGRGLGQVLGLWGFGHGFEGIGVKAVGFTKKGSTLLFAWVLVKIMITFGFPKY